MSEARKHWTKQQVKKPLGVIELALAELEAKAEAGQMPSSLRRKLKATAAKVRSLVEELNQWAITSGEKAIAEGGMVERKITAQPEQKAPEPAKPKGKVVKGPASKKPKK